MLTLSGISIGTKINPVDTIRITGISIGTLVPVVHQVKIGGLSVGVAIAPRKAINIKDIAFVLGESPNFQLKVQSITGDPLQGVEVLFDYGQESFSVLTSAQGIATTSVTEDQAYLMIVSIAGYQIYRHSFTAVSLPINWELTLDRIVPVVHTRDGNTAVNLFPQEPANIIYD